MSYVMSVVFFFLKKIMMEREIKFREVFEEMCRTFNEIEYMNGDISDVGNEIGYALGKVLENLQEDEIKTFIVGLRHGISLTNGTH
jgi:hypothetical protein